jgi:hypothetical protein
LGAEEEGARGGGEVRACLGRHADELVSALDLPGGPVVPAHREGVDAARLVHGRRGRGLVDPEVAGEVVVDDGHSDLRVFPEHRVVSDRSEADEEILVLLRLVVVDDLYLRGEEGEVSYLVSQLVVVA